MASRTLPKTLCYARAPLDSRTPRNWWVAPAPAVEASTNAGFLVPNAGFRRLLSPLQNAIPQTVCNTSRALLAQTFPTAMRGQLLLSMNCLNLPGRYMDLCRDYKCAAFFEQSLAAAALMSATLVFAKLDLAQSSYQQLPVTCAWRGPL